MEKCELRPGYQRPDSRAVKAQAHCPLRVLGEPDGQRRVCAELGRQHHRGKQEFEVKIKKMVKSFECLSGV